MAGGLKVAVAVALGYFLGRHRRFKLAIALAVAGATGRLGGTRGNLLEQGMKLVGSSPELEKIVNSVRGELFEAGKAAAKAAASRQVSSLSTKLQDRAEALQHAANVAAGLEETAAGAATGAAATATGAAGGAARTARGGVSGLRDRATGGFRTARARRRRGEEEEPEPYEDEYGDYAEYEEEEDYEEAPPRRGPRREGGRARDVEMEDEEEEEEEGPEDEDEGPAPRGRVVRDRPSPRSRPVRRRE
ncbi:hypothetical protein DQ384_19370 [Sphaerisporangium album]|uniref:DNA primase n=1 Tax=Sphaerisporangium album TaxID=509200 RepID=A0A367FHA2_9ACTN|nr:hypothetical protein [Sphaerisporangium album]RCG29736.1 hypothetical protein DQ384_19370 [Sphaerisporangium album]